MGILDLDPTQSQDITPEMAQRRRLLAMAMLQRGQDYSPVQSWTQGAARVANALVGGLQMRGVDRSEAAARKAAEESDTAALAPFLKGLGGSSDAAGDTSPAEANTSKMTMPSGGGDAGPQVTASMPTGAADAPNPPSTGAYPFPSSGWKPRTDAQVAAAPTVDMAGIEGGATLAQAQPMNLGPDAAPTPAAPAAQPQPDLNALMHTLSNPYSTPGAQAIAKAMLEKTLIPKAPLNVAPGNTLVDPNTLKPIYTAPPSKPDSTWGIISNDPLHGPQYGWINPTAKTTTAAPGAASVDEKMDTLEGPALLSYIKQKDPTLGAALESIRAGRSPIQARSKNFTELVGLLNRIEPGFDQTVYAARQRLRASFAPGGAGFKDKQATNQLLGHLNELYDAGHALDNFHSGGVPGVSWLGNQAHIGKLTSQQDPRLSSFSQAKNAVIDELSKNWKGTGGTSEADIARWSHDIENTNSPEQLDATIRQIFQLLQGKIRPYDEQISAMPDIKMLTPSGERLMQELDTKTTPGYVPTPTPEQAAAELKKRGIQ